MFETFLKVDLTHKLHEKIPTWNGSCGFSHSIKMDYLQGLRVMSYKCHAGIGTHMDAPSHFVPGGKDIADIALDKCIVPVCKIDVSMRRAPDLRITVEDIKSYENQHGRIPPQHLVIGQTGWEEFWQDPEKYRCCDENGKRHFPSFSREAAELLLQREVVGIGIDTLSPETGKDGFPIHHLLLGADRYILENLTSLQALPAKGAWIIVLPICVEQGSEAPVRAVGLVPKNERS